LTTITPLLLYFKPYRRTHARRPTPLSPAVTPDYPVSAILETLVCGISSVDSPTLVCGELPVFQVSVIFTERRQKRRTGTSAVQGIEGGASRR